MKEKESIELTTKQDTPTLEVRGNIFMPEPGQGEMPPVVGKTESDSSSPPQAGGFLEKANTNRQRVARELLLNLTPPSEGASIDEKSSHQIVRNELMERAGIPPVIGGSGDKPDDTPNNEGDQRADSSQPEQKPVTDELKDYIIKSRGGASIGITKNLKRILKENGISNEQIDYYSEHPEEFKTMLEERLAPKKVEASQEESSSQEEIIEKAEDYFTALEGLIKNSSEQTAKEAIEQKGQELIKQLIDGLPKKSLEKYLDQTEGLKDLSPGETKERFSDILRNIREERKNAGIEEPLVDNNQQFLSEEERKEQVRLQKEASERESSEEIKEEKQNKKEYTVEETVERLRRMAKGERVDDPTPTTSPRVENKGEGGEDAMTQALINDVIKRIQGLSMESEDSDTSSEFFELISDGKLDELLVRAYRSNSEEFKLRKEELNRIIKEKDFSTSESAQKMQEKLKTFLVTTVQAINKNKEGEQSSEYLPDTVRSVQELSKWIIETQDSELWGSDGVYPLLDNEGNFSQANFLIWLREESVKHHENNPNTEMTPLSSVGISTRYRDISVYAMSLLKEQYMKDTNNEGKVRNELAGQLIWEGFMFGELRTMALIYSQNMGDEGKIDQVLQQIHAKNSLTRPGNLRMLMTMPEEFSDKESERDTRVGDAFRVATDIYNNISDKETLIEILGDHQITQDDFKDAFRILNKLKDWEDISGNSADYGDFHYDQSAGFSYIDEEGMSINLFDKSGNMNMDLFVKIMNIYNAPQEESTKLELVREIVRLKAAQISGLKVTGIAFSKEAKLKAKEDYQKEVKALVGSGKTTEEVEIIATEKLMVKRYGHRSNIKFAETMAYSMQRPYGSAAKQDLNLAAYDAMTKTQTEGYLAKQSDEDSGGSTGLPEQIGLFRDLSPDPLSGIRTEGGRTISEIMRDLRAVDNGIEVSRIIKKEGKKIEQKVTKKELLDELIFRENAERSYTTNQQARAVQVYHTLSDGKTLDLSKIVTQSLIEGPKLDVGEFQKQINEETIKPFRYAFRNSNINLGQQVRMYDREKGEYTTVSQARKTLGDELYLKLQSDYLEQSDKDGKRLREKYPDEDNKPESGFNDFLLSKDANTRAAKNSSLGMIAAQLRSHRKFGALGHEWSYNRTETLIDAIKTIQVYEKNTATGRYEAAFDKYGNPKRYYNDKDIKWLRKNSGAEVWRMLAIDVAKEGGPALAGGTLEGIGKFLQALFS